MSKAMDAILRVDDRLMDKLETENAKLRAALEACRQHVRLNHKASGWWNDPAVWSLIKDHIDPALGTTTH